MSPNGIHPEKVEGIVAASHAALNPAVLYPAAEKYCIKPGKTAVKHGPPPSAVTKFVIDGLSPPGRKKFVKVADTQGRPLLGFTPQGADPVPTCSGPARAFEDGSL